MKHINFLKPIFATSLCIIALVAYAEGNTVRVFQTNSKLDCEELIAEYPAKDLGHLQIDNLNQASETFTVNGIAFTMIRVDGSTYKMGSNGRNDELPVHDEKVCTFYIGETEVTRALWNAVMNGTSSSNIERPDYPQSGISLTLANQFIEKLRLLTGRQFRIPTEAEWEYAARGGKNWEDNYTYSGCNLDQLNDYAWYGENAGSAAHPVATKKPNQLGIYDMTGNVCELCANYFTDSYADDSNSTGLRAIRGGCWHNTSGDIRVAYRNGNSGIYSSNIRGLRLAL